MVSIDGKGRGRDPKLVRQRSAAEDGGQTFLLAASYAIVGVCAFAVLVQAGFYVGSVLRGRIDRIHPHCYGLHRSHSQIKCPVRDLPPDFSRCRPNYYIAGAAKGGTTSLHTYLAKHRRVYPYRIRGGPRDGESFTALWRNNHHLEFSRFRWQDLRDHQIIGDATVQRLVGDSYSNFEDSCEDSRIFLLLRDPIERCYSYHLMNHRLGVTRHDSELPGDDDGEEEEDTEPLKPVAEVMREELEQFVNMTVKHPEVVTDLIDREWTSSDKLENCLFEGAYIVHLRRLLRPESGVSPERVRIYWSEEFFAQPHAVVADALAFMGLDPADVDLHDVTSKRYNARPEEGQKNSENDPGVAFPHSLRDEMERAMQPFNEELEKFLGERPPWMEKKN